MWHQRNTAEPADAVVNATYKSGTNDWHGTVFWQIRNSTATLILTISPAKQLRHFTAINSDFPGGGALLKNKLFIFRRLSGYATEATPE